MGNMCIDQVIKKKGTFFSSLDLEALQKYEGKPLFPVIHHKSSLEGKGEIFTRPSSS
jgi:hypothetical protein